MYFSKLVGDFFKHIATSHYLKQWWLVYWGIYVSLGLNEFRHIDADGKLDASIIERSAFNYSEYVT